MKHVVLGLLSVAATLVCAVVVCAAVPVGLGDPVAVVVAVAAVVLAATTAGSVAVRISSGLRVWAGHGVFLVLTMGLVSALHGRVASRDDEARVAARWASALGLPLPAGLKTAGTGEGDVAVSAPTPAPASVSPPPVAVAAVETVAVTSTGEGNRLEVYTINGTLVRRVPVTKDVQQTVAGGEYLLEDFGQNGIRILSGHSGLVIGEVMGARAYPESLSITFNDRLDVVFAQSVTAANCDSSGGGSCTRLRALHLPDGAVLFDRRFEGRFAAAMTPAGDRVDVCGERLIAITANSGATLLDVPGHPPLRAALDWPGFAIESAGSLLTCRSTGRPTLTVNLATSAVTQAAPQDPLEDWLTDGQSTIERHQKRIRLVDTKSGQALWEAPAVEALISPEGDFILSRTVPDRAAPDRVEWRERTSGRLIASVPGAPGAMSADGRSLVVTQANEVAVHRWTDATPLLRIQHPGLSRSVSLSRDGQHVAFLTR